MANFGQAIFVGSEVVITCGKKMSCCDREQAKAKCDNYNKDIAGDPKDKESLPGPLNISPGSGDLASAKCTAQGDAWRNFRDKMENAKTPAERKKIAIENSVSPCVGEAVAERWERGRRTSRGLGVQMDHMVEVKWGGPAGLDGLMALGSRVNNFFGSVAKRIGDDMLNATPKQEDITAIHFVCDPPCRPPRTGDEKNDYSTGPAGGSVPKGAGDGPKPRTYLED